MKTAIVLAAFLVLSMGIVAAQEATHCEHWSCGTEYGQHHAEMAKAGMLDKEMNPGMHQGYSVCAKLP